MGAARGHGGSGRCPRAGDGRWGGLCRLAVSSSTETALRDRSAPAPAAASTPPSTPSAQHPSVREPRADQRPGRHRRAAPRPEPVLEPGDRGVRVRELQARLDPARLVHPADDRQLRHATSAGGAGLPGQAWLRRHRRGRPAHLAAAGRDDPDALRDELFNRAGPALFERGDDGPEVRVIQARLRQIAWFFGDVSDHYGDQTAEAVRGFQGKRGIPETGKVDRRTLDLLVGMTSEPDRRRRWRTGRRTRPRAPRSTRAA